jgi:hypothetical protein
MRKIERLMNKAITEGLNWSLDNTRVETDGDNISTVYLYGNKIARIGNNFVQLFDGRHQTVTTKSRLNAICWAHCVDGEGVFQKRGQWFIRVWNKSTKQFDTEVFFSGYMLADA